MPIHPDGRQTHTINWKLRPEVWQEIRDRAKEEGCTQSRIVEVAVGHFQVMVPRMPRGYWSCFRCKADLDLWNRCQWQRPRSVVYVCSGCWDAMAESEQRDLSL